MTQKLIKKKNLIKSKSIEQLIAIYLIIFFRENIKNILNFTNLKVDI